MIVSPFKYYLVFLFLILQQLVYGQEIEAYDDYISVSNDRSYVIDVVGNDVYSGAISLKIISYTSNGNPVFPPRVDGINLKIRYNSAASNVIEYEVCNKDPETECRRAFLYINITLDPISATNDIYAIKKQKEYKLKVMENDLYKEPASLTIIKNSKFGTTAVSNKTILYTPDNLDFSKDSLQYRIVDKDNNQSKAYVYLYAKYPGSEVKNTAPKVTDITIDLQEDQSVNFQLTRFTSAFSDKDNDQLKKIKFISLPDNGKLLYSSQEVKVGDIFYPDQIKDLKYTPDKDYNGSDEIKWHASDPTEYSVAPAKILINIAPVNDAPVAVNDAYNIHEDETVLLDVLKNDYDPEGKSISITKIEINAALGQATQSGNKIQYTPSAQLNGKKSLSYTISDGDLTATANVEVIITPANESQEATVNDIYLETVEDQELMFHQMLFREATIDPDGDELQAIVVRDLVSEGTLYLAGEAIQPEVQIPAAKIDSLLFEPEKNWSGVTNFTWRAITNSELSQNQSRANITVHPFADDIIIYSGFSPNGDNLNDQWNIGNIMDYPENMVKIFNRYNILIFQQSNYDNKVNVWKGDTNIHHFNQEHQAPDDIYYYIISLNNDQKILKGAVTLKR